MKKKWCVLGSLLLVLLMWGPAWGKPVRIGPLKIEFLSGLLQTRISPP